MGRNDFLDERKLSIRGRQRKGSAMKPCENCLDIEKCEMYGGCWNPPAREKPGSPSDARACSPLSAGELMDMAIHGRPIPASRVLATFYHGETSPAVDYEAKACEWAFVGPSRPPYELAQWALKLLSENSTIEPHAAFVPYQPRQPVGETDPPNHSDT